MIFKIVNFLEINNNNYLLYNRLLSSSSWRRKKGGVGCGHPSEVLQCNVAEQPTLPIAIPTSVVMCLALVIPTMTMVNLNLTSFLGLGGDPYSLTNLWSV